MKKYFVFSICTAMGQLVFGQAGRGAVGSGTSPAGAPSLPVTLSPPRVSSVPGVTPSQSIAPAAGTGILAPSINGSRPSSGPVTAVNFNSLPLSVRNTIISSQASGVAIGPIAQQNTASGPVYTTSVIQNGQPVQIQVSASGAIVPGSPAIASSPGFQSGTALPATPITTLDSGFGGQIGIPLSTLPAGLQTGIINQAGNVAVQSVSQTQTPNGPLYKVIANQNGTLTQMQFAANGNLISSTPVSGITGTLPLAGIAANNNLDTSGGLPGSGLVVWEDLPLNVQNGIRAQTSDNPIDRITPRATTNGMAYNVQFQRNGAAQSVLIGPDGKMLASSSPSPTTIPNASNSSRIAVSDLPDAVESTLKKEAPDADIQFINRQTRPQGEVYTLGFHSDNRYTELVIDANGQILRDSRAVPVIVKSGAEPVDTEQTLLTYDNLPEGIKNSVKAYTPEINVSNVQASTRDGKSVYEIEFFTDGHTDRVVIGKDGSFIARDHNVPPTLASAVPPIPEATLPTSETLAPEVIEAAGNPAARETGTGKDNANTIGIKQLPLPAQNTVKALSGLGLIETITPRVQNSTVVYEVRFLDNGKERTVTIDKDGNPQKR